jgi:hypothetical protein
VLDEVGLVLLESLRGEKAHADKMRMLGGNEGRHWTDVSTSQGRPVTTGHHQKLDEARRDLPLGEGTALLELDFGLLASKIA